MNARRDPTTCGTLVELALVVVVSTGWVVVRWLRDRLGL